MALTENGYEPLQATDIKEAIVEAMKERNANFSELDADVQNALLDTSIIKILQFDNIISQLINAPALTYNNEFMFKVLGNSLGLSQKGAYKSQVILEFSGSYGDFIPKGTRVGEFETSESVTIPTTKKVSVLATSDSEEIAQANTLTEISTNLNIDGLSVTNPQASYAAVESESYTDYKERVQKIYRNARVASSEYAIAKIQALDGVTPRLVNARITSKTDDDGVTWQGVEFVVGGGDSTEIANVLFSSFIETQKLLSAPSDNDTGRTQTTNINFYGNALSISYTTPKLINFGLKVGINFSNLTISANNINTIISETLTSYINALQVGNKLNKRTIENLIINAIKEYNVDSNEISALQITPQYSDDGINFADDVWDDNGYYAKLDFDCYLILQNLVIEIGG